MGTDEWRVDSLLAYLDRHRWSAAWGELGRDGNELGAVIDALHGVPYAGWRVRVETWPVELESGDPMFRIGFERFLVVELLMNREVESALAAWWVCEISSKLHMRLFDREGLLLDHNIMDWDVEFEAAEAEAYDVDVMRLPETWQDDLAPVDLGRPWSPDQDREDDCEPC